MKNIIVSLVFYTILLFLAVFSLQLLPHIPSRYLPVLELLPFMLLFVSVFLGLKFNRSQIIFSAILFTLIYTYIFWFAFADNQRHFLTLNAISILLAINITLISFYSERGVFTLVGILRMLVIALPAAALIWLLEHQYDFLNQFIYQSLFVSLKVELHFFSQLVLLSVLAAFFIISLLYLYRSNPFHMAMFTGMILVLYGITFSVTKTLTIAVLFSWALMLPLFTLVSEFYRMAYLDELTSLPGRRALNETMNKLGSKYVIAMLDVDHFKKFNDTYGHDAGDDVLRLLANRLKGISGGGKPFRYGGEEFTLVFSGMTVKEVDKHLEKLRESVANKKFALRKQERRKSDKKSKKAKQNREVKVTISIGYAQRSDKAATPEQVIKAADKALYRAKRKGRNCISL